MCLLGKSERLPCLPVLGMATSLWPPVPLLFTSHRPTQASLQGPVRPQSKTKVTRWENCLPQSAKPLCLGRPMIPHSGKTTPEPQVRLWLSMSKSQATSQHTVPQPSFGILQVLVSYISIFKIYILFIHFGEGYIQATTGHRTTCGLKSSHPPWVQTWAVRLSGK